jgi:hypothetical protein
MFSFTSKGSLEGTIKHLRKISRGDFFQGLDKYAREGVNALARATPLDSGLTAVSWGYEIQVSRTSCVITWINTDTENGFPVAIMLQYGYATGTGGYVQGRDYINPTIRPVFDKIEEAVRRAVTSS